MKHGYYTHLNGDVTFYNQAKNGDPWAVVQVTVPGWLVESAYMALHCKDTQNDPF